MRQQKKPAAVLRQRPAGRYGLLATRAMRKIGCLAKVVTAWVSYPHSAVRRMTGRPLKQGPDKQPVGCSLGEPPLVTTTHADHLLSTGITPHPRQSSLTRLRAFGPAGATLAPGTHYERIVGGSCDLGKKNRGFPLRPVCRIGRQNPPIPASAGFSCLAYSTFHYFRPLIIRVCR